MKPATPVEPIAALPDPGTARQQALTVFQRADDLAGEAVTLDNLGRPADALAHHTSAHAIATDIGNRDQEARAQTGLGHAYRALSDPIRARDHYQHALRIYTDLDLPQADQVRGHLAVLDADTAE